MQMFVVSLYLKTTTDYVIIMSISCLSVAVWKQKQPFIRQRVCLDASLRTVKCNAMAIDLSFCALGKLRIQPTTCYLCGVYIFLLHTKLFWAEICFYFWTSVTTKLVAKSQKVRKYANDFGFIRQKKNRNWEQSGAHLTSPHCSKHQSCSSIVVIWKFF